MHEIFLSIQNQNFTQTPKRIPFQRTKESIPKQTPSCHNQLWNAEELLVFILISSGIFSSTGCQQASWWSRWHLAAGRQIRDDSKNAANASRPSRLEAERSHLVLGEHVWRTLKDQKNQALNKSEHHHLDQHIRCRALHKRHSFWKFAGGEEDYEEWDMGLRVWAMHERYL